MIQPTGITIKPGETQLKEFGKRAKNLDKNSIFQILCEKLENYEKMSDSTNIKILIVFILIKALESSLCCASFN